MANEARISLSLQITKGNINFKSSPTAFLADVANTGGPSPGAVTVPLAGLDIDFSALTEPGLAFLQNYDPTNYVELGIYEPTGAVYYPLLEFLPGECYIVRFSRNLLEQYAGSGTGTTGPENKVRLKAHVAACKFLVNAFER